MRSSKQLIGLGLGLLGLAALPLMGCGGAICGEGTIEQDGECVLEGVSCAEGEVVHDGHCVEACSATTEMNEDGKCVVAPAACEAGSSLAADTNQCIVAEEACEGGTALSSAGTCLPTDEICDDGTSFSESTGLCLPDATCRAGDVIVDGVCASMAESLIAQADIVANANSNPIHDGEYNELTLGAVGETTIYAGTIHEPSDIKGDEEGIYQHLDFYEFTAEEGDWIEVSIHSTGNFTPHLSIESLDTVDNVSFERETSLFTSNSKSRLVAIPADGTYVITVGPELTFSDSSLLIGGDDWDYAGTIGRVETPDAVAHDFEYGDNNLTGTFGDLDQNFFVMTGEPGKSFSVTFEQSHPVVDPVVQVWETPTQFVEEFAGDFLVTMPASGEIYFAVDWEVIRGSIGLDYELTAVETFMLGPGEEIFETVTAEIGDVLEVRQWNDQEASLTVTVTDFMGEVVLTETLDDDFDSAFGADTPVRYIGLETGEYSVSITNNGSSTVPGVNYNVEVIEPTPIVDFGTAYDGFAYNGERYEQGFFTLMVPTTGDYDVTIERVDHDGFPAIRTYIYIDNERLHRHITTLTGTSVPRTFTWEFESDFVYTIRVGGESGTALTTAWMDYEITVEPTSSN